MTTSDIDDAVLSAGDRRWQKVAMIIIRAAEKLGTELPGGDEGHHIIGERIAVLVAGGRLIAQGDISRWRHSEVRLPE